MRQGATVGTFGLAVAAVVAFWAWLGAAVPMPPSPFAADGRLYCISYAPFRGGQTPLDLATHIPRAQIEEDLRRLKPLTDCVRTYSNDFGIDQVPAVAERLGMQVIQGLWLSSHADRSRHQVDTAIALARQYPRTIRAIVVGNEVLLRGEMSPARLAETIAAVRAAVQVPVTYADVWEFWLRHRELAAQVDFVTVHILPYWEDVPIPARDAAAHVHAIRARVAAAFPGKEILIGETGWPSQGRMREGARPAPAEQARVLHEVLALAQRENYRVNLIEAFDQPWKRHLEGTVGGYWGLYDDRSRAPKFRWGEPVSNHPQWPWQAAGGAVMALLVLAAGFGVRRRGAAGAPSRLGPLAVAAIAAGAFVPLAVEEMVIASFGPGGWLRSAAFLLCAVAAPLLCAVALVEQRGLPAFATILARRELRPRDPLLLALGCTLIAVVVLALQSALGLVFDPRYRDFPNAPLTAAVIPFLLAALAAPRGRAPRGAAETAAASVLGLSAAYIALNEGAANWQALWFCTLALLLALTLLRIRGAPN